MVKKRYTEKSKIKNLHSYKYQNVYFARKKETIYSEPVYLYTEKEHKKASIDPHKNVRAMLLLNHISGGKLQHKVADALKEDIENWDKQLEEK